MVKPTQKSYLSWSAIFCVIVYYKAHGEWVLLSQHHTFHRRHSEMVSILETCSDKILKIKMSRNFRRSQTRLDLELQTLSKTCHSKRSKFCPSQTGWLNSATVSTNEGNEPATISGKLWRSYFPWSNLVFKRWKLLHIFLFSKRRGGGVLLLFSHQDFSKILKMENFPQLGNCWNSQRVQFWIETNCFRQKPNFLS